MNSIAAFSLGYLAGMVTLIAASWIGSVLARRARQYPKTYARDVPMTMEELQSRRERLTQSLMESV